MRRLMIPVLLLSDGRWSDCSESVSDSILVGQQIPSNGTSSYFPPSLHQSLVLVPFFLVLEVVLIVVFSAACLEFPPWMNSGSTSCRLTSLPPGSSTVRRKHSSSPHSIWNSPNWLVPDS